MQVPIAEEKTCSSTFRQACKILGKYSLVRWDHNWTLWDVWRSGGTSCCPKTQIVKSWGGNIVLWSCFFSAYGTGALHITEGSINRKIYQDVHDKNLLPYTRVMKRKWGWTFQQDKDPKRKPWNSQIYTWAMHVTIQEASWSCHHQQRHFHEYTINFSKCVISHYYTKFLDIYGLFSLYVQIGWVVSNMMLSSQYRDY